MATLLHPHRPRSDRGSLTGRTGTDDVAPGLAILTGAGGSGAAPDGPFRDDRAANRPPLRRWASWLRPGLLLAVLAVVAALLIAHRRTVVAAGAGLGDLRWGWVAAAAGAEAVSLSALARLHQRMLRAGAFGLRWGPVLAILSAGAAITNSVPLAGSEAAAAFTYRQYRRRGVTGARAAWVVAVSGVLVYLAAGAMMAAGALVSGDPAPAAAGLSVTAAVIGVIVAAVLARRVPAVARGTERVAVAVLRGVQRVSGRPAGSAAELVATGRAGFTSLRITRRDRVVTAVLAGAYRLGDAACLALAIKAAGLAIPAGSLLLAWSAVPAAGGIIALTPGGLGVVEAALTAALAAVGLPATGAAAAVLTYRLLSFWAVVAGGWVVFLALRRQDHVWPAQGGGRP